MKWEIDDAPSSCETRRRSMRWTGPHIQMNTTNPRPSLQVAWLRGSANPVWVPRFRPAGTSHGQTSLTSSRAGCSLEPTPYSVQDIHQWCRWPGPRSSSPPGSMSQRLHLLCLICPPIHFAQTSNLTPDVSTDRPTASSTHRLPPPRIFAQLSITYFFLQTTRRRCEQPCS
jgi:hypothetical protein